MYLEKQKQPIIWDRENIKMFRKGRSGLVSKENSSCQVQSTEWVKQDITGCHELTRHLLATDKYLEMSQNAN